MSYNQEVYDRIVQHLADTRLYELEAQQNVGSIVKRHRVRLRDLLVRNIKSDARPEIERTMKELNSSVSTSAQEYSGAAVTFHTNNLNKAVGSFFRVQQPKGFDVLKEIIGPNIETGRTLEKHFNAIGTAELVRVQGIIGRGLAQGDSREVIIQRVLETTKMSETQTRALVRTSITRTESVALDRVMTENADILDGYRFTAVLDANTSAICSAHDGKIYPLNEVRYRPPLHWNCRSSLVPVLKAKTSMEQIESKRLDKDALAKVPTKRLSGTPIDKEDYSVWLKRQPMEVKVSHLGNEERVALFEKGTLSVKEFFTSKGRGLSIGALRRLDNKRTSIFPTRQAALAKSVDDGYTVNVARPYDLTRSIDQQNKLRAMYISDADSMNQAISVTDFKGTSLAGKRTSRMRANNEFDERVVSYDPFTGEMKNTLLYDPDFGVYQERLDFLKQSKLLTADQKDFIANFAESLEDKISVNQQAVVVENLRVIFERYAKDKKPWENFMNVARGESQYSVVNVSRILDRRSRERADLFGSYMSGEEPKVQIFGNYYSFSDLQENLLENQRYVDTWNIRHGYDKARDAFYSRQTPLRQFFFDPKKTKKTKFAKVLGKWAEANIPGYKLYKDWDKPTETMLQKVMREAREEYRNIVDLEFIFQNNKAGFIERMLSQKFLGGTKTKSITEQAKEDLLGDAKGIEVIAKIMNLVADGKSSDYDALAINIGKTINENWTPLFPFSGVTMADHHQAGSRILEALREQKKIRVISRGKVRRAAIDIDTGRPNGPWKETVSREVSILDKDMLDLQIRNRQLIIGQRIGVVSDRDKLYVRPGEKTYFDARGNNTGQSVITRRASGNYDKVLIDRDFADMLNHTMDVEYEVDRPFASFMDEIVRFRDPRGNVQKYDDLNDFRKLILQRGEQGFGFMQTVKWHMQRDKPFKAIAQIDGRGRVYYQGYLTPTGGEVVRPFLNSAKAMEVDNIALKELTIQIGSMLGPATEALTQAGRFEIFMRNEADVLSLGKLMMSNTQRDRRMREFLEHPIIRAHDAEEIPKVARLALEYTRIHEHFKGDFTNMSRKPYYTKLMIENDASSSGAQIIGLSTGDRSISINSNVLATNKKNRLYDLVAMDTASDPEFHAIQSLSGANIQWTDLAKAAKAQNMVSFYGAGKATQAANIEAKFAKVLSEKGYTVITRDELRPVLKTIDKAIKDAEYLGAENVVLGLKQTRKELLEVVNNEIDIGTDLIKAARDIHPDVSEFIDKLTNVRVGLIGPNEFKQVSAIMSKHLAERAPITGKFVQFWKQAGKLYIDETEKVDIPWVTFDGKVLYQRYRPKVQTVIDFIDPVTGRRVRNIYQDSVTDGNLKGKSSVIRASIGLGVNGNHMNDAAIVRRFHLWGRKNNVPTATIHDAFFTNIGDATKAKFALREIYADALEGDTIRNTLKRMRDDGMSEKTYQLLLARAKEDGLIDPPNKITRADILAPIPKGMDWYGIGP